MSKHELIAMTRREVENLQRDRIDLMPDVLKDTYERMSAERFAEAAQLRAIGDAQRRRPHPPRRARHRRNVTGLAADFVRVAVELRDFHVRRLAVALLAALHVDIPPPLELGVGAGRRGRGCDHGRLARPD